MDLQTKPRTQDPREGAHAPVAREPRVRTARHPAPDVRALVALALLPALVRGQPQVLAFYGFVSTNNFSMTTTLQGATPISLMPPASATWTVSSSSHCATTSGDCMKLGSWPATYVANTSWFSIGVNTTGVTPTNFSCGEWGRVSVAESGGVTAASTASVRHGAIKT